MEQHRHVQLIGGRKASVAQEYPRKLCEAMVEGIKRQIEADEWNVVKVKVMSTKQGESEPAPKHDEDDDDMNERWWAYDDITGAEISPKKVKEARQEEIGYIGKHNVYRKVRRSSVPAGEKIMKFFNCHK